MSANEVREIEVVGVCTAYGAATDTDNGGTYSGTYQEFCEDLSNIGNILHNGVVPIENGGTGNSVGYIQTGKDPDCTIGEGSTAEGLMTSPEGMYSHTEGFHTATTFRYSHAEGIHTIASGQAQHVFGKYNEPNSTDVEIVGWGTTSQTKNIRTLDRDGNQTLAGGLTLYDAYPVVPVYPNAGSHNSIFRGKNLGTSVTADQFDAIAAGTFDDMYIGDYWVIHGTTYLIAHFNYWLGTGNPSNPNVTDNHVVIVPLEPMNSNTPMYDDISDTGNGYTGSDMYNQYLPAVTSIIETDFGASNILMHDQLLCRSYVSGLGFTKDWQSTTVELMTEMNVFGSIIYGAVVKNYIYDYGLDNNIQFRLFALAPEYISKSSVGWWLRDISVNHDSFYCYVSRDRRAEMKEANYTNSTPSGEKIGIRPAFAIYKGGV